MRHATPTLALFLALLAGSAALAGGPQLEFRGEIKRLDPVARTLVVQETKTPKQELEFQLASDAAILAAGKQQTLGDLKTGERVTVHYTQDGAKHEAHRVDVAAAKS